MPRGWTARAPPREPEAALAAGRGPRRASQRRLRSPRCAAPRPPAPTWPARSRRCTRSFSLGCAPGTLRRPQRAAPRRRPFPRRWPPPASRACSGERRRCSALRSRRRRRRGSDPATWTGRPREARRSPNESRRAPPSGATTRGGGCACGSGAGGCDRSCCASCADTRCSARRRRRRGAACTASSCGWRRRPPRSARLSEKDGSRSVAPCEQDSTRAKNARGSIVRAPARSHLEAGRIFFFSWHTQTHFFFFTG